MFGIILSITFLYVASLVYAAAIFTGEKERNLATSETEQVSFSLIIPFRNEEHCLPVLLQSIKRLDYPNDKLEILFCDDHSDDNSAKFVESQLGFLPFTARLIQNNTEENGKKVAITNAINLASNPFIVTTDADCSFPEKWLQILSFTINTSNATLVAGPVKYYAQTQQNPFAVYQIIENAALVLFGAVGIIKQKPFMANGANLCFLKSMFVAVNGYSGNLDIPSGDDEFLLQKFAALDSAKVVFCKSADAMVETPIQPSLNGFFHQRVRWASKVKKHKQNKVFLAQCIVAIFYLSILYNLVLGLVYANYFTAILPLVVKLLGDMYFNMVGLKFFNLHKSLISIIIVSFLQVVLVPIIGIISLRGNFSWKNRKYQI